MDSCQTLHGDQFVQNIVVMRHGDRIDNAEPLWISTAERPWDPPLTDAGKIRAWGTGKKIRNFGFRIDRVFVSPFIRCIETASEVITALCSKEADELMETSENVVIDPSMVKVSIEYGLCEALTREAINIELAPKDGKWIRDLSELEAMLPAGTLDCSVDRVYQELPKWEEQLQGAKDRYKEVFLALADKFPRENLLLVTHGEGVGVSVSAFLKDVVVYEADYCAYSHSQRIISFSPTQSFTAEDLKVLTRNGLTGIRYFPKNSLPLVDY